MKIWQRESTTVVLRRATAADIPELNRVFSESFTDRYRRDGLVGVRVPQLNPDIWLYAIRDAGDGAMLWYDERDVLVGFNMVHFSGSEGWMGPLAVRPDRQARGLGTTMVQAAVEWLTQRGAATIGLETMPRTVDNIGFYAGLGFLPGALTITVGIELGDETAPDEHEVVLLGDLPAGADDALLGEIIALMERLSPAHDFTREMALTRELGIGDTVVLRRGGRLDGYAVWHGAPLAAGRWDSELRVLKLAARTGSAFRALVAAIESCARQRGLKRVAFRCQTAESEAFAYLLDRGYRVRWTDLRMTLDGYPERPPQGTGVVFSNWEI